MTRQPPNLCALRPPHELLADLTAGVASLHELVSRWSPLLPTAAELAGAVATTEGVRRILCHLRHHVEGGAADAV